MPQDNSLNFTTSVDLSGLEEGLAAAKVGIEDLVQETSLEEQAIDAVMDAFKEFDAILANNIAQHDALVAAEQAVIDGVTAQIVARQQAAEALAAENIAQIILAETSVQRSAKEIAAANVRRGIDAEQASRTAFAIESNASYAASVEAVAASYAALTAQQAANAAAQTALEATVAAEASLGLTVEEANAQIEAQGLLWLQNQATTTSATEATVAATAANAGLSASTATLAEQNAAQTVAISATNAALAAYQALAKKGELVGVQLAAAYDKALASGLGFTEAMNAAVAAVNASTASNAANTASLRANAVASEVDTAATYNRAEAFGTARIAAGLATGSLTGVEYGIARIGAASSIMGPLLEAAMPVALIAAVGYAVVELGEYLYKSFDIGNTGAYKLGQNLEALDLDFKHLADSIELQTEKMKEQDAKIEKVPFNGAKLALLEAADAADKFQKSLDGAYEKELRLLNLDITKGGLAPSTLQKMLPGSFGSAGLHDEDIMLQEHVKWMQMANTEQAKQNELTSYGDVLYGKYYETLDKVKQAHEASGNDKSATRYDKEATALLQMITALEGEQNALTAEQAKEAEEAKHQQIKDDKPGKDPNIAKLKQIRDQFEEYKAQMVSTHGEFTAGEGTSFWEAYLTTFKSGSDQAREVLTQFVQFQSRMHTELQEAVKKGLASQDKYISDEGVQRNIADMNKWQASVGADVMRTGEHWADYYREIKNGEDIQATSAYAIEKAALAAAHAGGSITQLSEDQQLAAIHAAEYVAELKDLNEQLARLKVLAQNLHPGDEGYEKNIQQQQSVANQILKAQGAKTAAAITDNGKITQDITQPFTKAFQTIETDFFKAQQSIFNGTQSISRAFGKMGIDLIEQTEIVWEKMVLSAAENAVKMQIVNSVKNAAIVANDATAAGTSAIIKKTSAAEEIFIDAKTAAAGAFKALAGIPVVGPELGAIAAAVTFAAVMALGSFDVGGIIPGSGAVPIIGHGGERVLTTGQTATFEKMVNGGAAGNAPTGGGGSPVHLHYEPKVQAYDRSGMRSTLQAHSSDIVDIVRGAVSSGAIKVPR